MYQKKTIVLSAVTNSDAEPVVLTGNNRLLFNILQANIYCLIKIEGKKFQFDKKETYYHIINIKKGVLESFVSYPPEDLAEYRETQTTMLLNLDNIDTEFVIREFLKSIPTA